MISVTPEAAKFIRESAKQGNTQGLPLRIAAIRQQDGGIHYGLGFDDTARDGDQTYKSEGIDLVVAPASLELLNGTVIDYVELEPEKFDIIFVNPNDPVQHNTGKS